MKTRLLASALARLFAVLAGLGIVVAAVPADASVLEARARLQERVVSIRNTIPASGQETRAPTKELLAQMPWPNWGNWANWNNWNNWPNWVNWGNWFNR